MEGATAVLGTNLEPLQVSLAWKMEVTFINITMVTNQVPKTADLVPTMASVDSLVPAELKLEAMEANLELVVELAFLLHPTREKTANQEE